MHEKFLTKALLYCTFFPFVSPFVINTDLQPPVVIVALLIVIKKLLIERKIERKLLFILCFVVFFLLYMSPNMEFANLKLSRLVSLSSGLIIFSAWYLSLHAIKPNSVCKLVYIYALFSLMYLLKLPIYDYIVSNFVYLRNDIYILGRGASILSPEPSFFSGVLIGLLCLVEYMYNELSKYEYVTCLILIIVMFLLNASGTGFVFLFCYFLFKIKRLLVENSLAILTILALCSIFIYITFSENFDIIRIFAFSDRVIDLYLKLQSGNILDNDRSLFVRFFDLFNGIKLFFMHPFGVGVGGEKEVLYAYGDSISNYRYHSQTYPGFVSSFANHLLTYGVFFLLCLLYIFKLNINLYSVISLMLLSFSFSSAFPVIWILACMSKKEKYFEYR